MPKGKAAAQALLPRHSVHPCHSIEEFQRDHNNTLFFLQLGYETTPQAHIPSPVKSHLQVSSGSSCIDDKGSWSMCFGGGDFGRFTHAPVFECHSAFGNILASPRCSAISVKAGQRSAAILTTAGSATASAAGPCSPSLADFSEFTSNYTSARSAICGRCVAGSLAQRFFGSCRLLS